MIRKCRIDWYGLSSEYYYRNWANPFPSRFKQNANVRITLLQRLHNQWVNVGEISDSSASGSGFFDALHNQTTYAQFLLKSISDLRDKANDKQGIEKEYDFDRDNSTDDWDEEDE